jgi:N-acetylglutamate synthase-like GNAT family acetyltransferase
MDKIVKAKIEHTKDITLLNKQFNLDIPEFYWNSEKWISSEIEKGNYYVLLEDTQILGAMNLEKYKKEYVVSTIAIKENMQGKNLGRKLIKFAKETAIKENVHLLTVDSFVNYNLEGFYTKCGFTKRNKLGNYKDYPYFRFFMKL